jgi:hypothetical protein
MTTLSVISSSIWRRDAEFGERFATSTHQAVGRASGAQKYSALNEPAASRLAIQRGEMFERAANDPASERNDQTRLFAQGNELIGADKADVGALPAQQRFDCDRPLEAVDDRLIVQRRTPSAVVRAAQRVLQLQAIDGARVRRGRVETERCRDRPLWRGRARRRPLRISSSGRGAVVGINADADARRGVEFPSL